MQAVNLRTEEFVPGEVLAGKYVVERVVGIGGVGVVVAARHIDLDETVALKFLLPEMQKRPDIVARFAQEAKAAVRIKSEYAARVFDVGVMPGRGPFLVMEYLEGSNLADVLEALGPMPLKRAVAFTLEVCEALAVAHSYGIIHRDIKPENIFLSRRSDGTEVAKILDFGISKAALSGSPLEDSELYKTQSLMGTPLYMSPEQIRASSDADERSDIWSLGVVFYEMLTQRFPFDGETVPKICSQVLESHPPPVTNFVSVPDGIQAVIDRCFQKDPARRFQNVAELAIALLPFGPIKSRVSAERTSTILEASGKSSGVTFRFDSAAPSSTDPPFSSGPYIPAAPIAPSFSSGPPNVITGHPTGQYATVSTSPEAMEQFAKESARTRRTIVAAAVIVLGIGGAAASFLVGSMRGGNKDVAPQQLVVSVAQAPAPPPLATAADPLGGNVTIALAATPADARIFLDDVPVTNPLRRPVGRDGKPHSVRAEAFNYVTRSVAVTFDSDKEIVLALDRLPPSMPRGFVGRAPPPPSPPAASPSPSPPPPAASPIPPTPPPAASRPMGEVDLPKTRKPVRPLDTSQPW